MNTYNENLHSSVVGTLQDQELDQKKLKSKLDADTFTLYFAEGAEIIAREKLDESVADFTNKQAVYEQAVKCDNLASNLVLSAAQQKSYAALSVTNAAVAASNIQVAAKAIQTLAGDMGNIYNRLHSADYGTQIYQQSTDANTLLNYTAYEAELASQLAMEASYSMAEIAAVAIADKASSTDGAINGILEIATSELSTVVTTVETNFAATAAASVTAKLAEGEIESSEVDYLASKKAYDVNKRELNLNLTVDASVSKPVYTVYFDPYLCPFKGLEGLKTITTDVLDNPVQDYNILIVKESKRATFPIASAENLLLNTDQYVPLKDAPGNEGVEIPISKILDSDGDPVLLGDKYVVFILVRLNEAYKKAINTFDDFLSAPSKIFRSRKLLHQARSISVDATTETLTFEVVRDSDVDLEYRCMFLPYPDHVLSDASIDNIGNEVEITEDDQTIKDLDDKMQKLQEQIDVLEKLKDKSNKKLLDQLIREFNDAQKEKGRLQDDVDYLKKADARNLAALNQKSIFFNLKLAENVAPGNYIPHDVKSDKHSEDKPKTAKYTLHISKNVMDNFGRPLIDKKSYIPTILSYYNGDEDDRKKFINALSDWKNTPTFKYIKK